MKTPTPIGYLGGGGGGGAGQADWLGPLTMTAADYSQASDQDPGANMSSCRIDEVTLDGSTWLRMDSGVDAAGGAIADGVRFMGALRPIGAGDFFIGVEFVVQVLSRATGEPIAPNTTTNGIQAGVGLVDGADAETAAWNCLMFLQNLTDKQNQQIRWETQSGFNTPQAGGSVTLDETIKNHARFFIGLQRSATDLKAYLWPRTGTPALIGSAKTVSALAGQICVRIESWKTSGQRWVIHWRETDVSGLPFGPA